MSRFWIVAALTAGVVGPGLAQQVTVVNAASYEAGLPAGGSLASAFCSGFSDPTLKPGTYLASSYPLPYELGGLRVTVNNALAPLLAVVITSAGQSQNAQINFQVPLERNATLSSANPGYPGSVDVYSTQNSGGARIATATPGPRPMFGGFFHDAKGYIIAQHASDYSLVTPENPAHAGETIVAYADDFFAVWPPPPIGLPTPLQLQFLVVRQELTVTLQASHLYLQSYPPAVIHAYRDPSSQELQITFRGLAPGLVGVEQINFVVPANQAPGDWSLFFDTVACPTGPPRPGGSCSVGTGYASAGALLPVR